MGTFVLQLICSFGAAYFFGVIVNVPRRTLWRCGITGMSGWIVSWIMMRLGVSQLISVFFGAMVVSVFSIIFAKSMRVPATTFNLSGFFPLVPGIVAYQTVNAFVAGDYMLGMSLLTRTFAISISIAFAIVMVEVFYWLFVNLKR